MVADCISSEILVGNEFRVAQDVEIPKNVTVIYDVLRVVDGVPLFAEDHSARFFRSFELANLPQPFAEPVFVQSMLTFIEHTGLQNGNIRCVYPMGRQPQLHVYEIKHSYPTAEMYAQGVACGTFEGERSNPNVKQEAPVKTNAYKKIAETGVYEVILVDSQRCVTEGSKSNTFFVKNGEVVTARAEDVLCGITRLQIIDIIKSLGITLHERKIALDELRGFDAAFVSGTSPKVLPIRRIDDVTFNVADATVKRIAEAYNQQISEYINNHKTVK